MPRCLSDAERAELCRDLVRGAPGLLRKALLALWLAVAAAGVVMLLMALAGGL
jgi:hypothetical protein